MSRILVTDDNSDYRASIIELLQLESYEVIDADNGVDALRLMIEEHPELVLCDVDMPGMSGLEVLQAAKNDPQLRAIPFIIVTGNTDEFVRLRITALGADGYIIKPMNIDALLTLLQRLLS